MSNDPITAVKRLLYPVGGIYLSNADKDELESWSELQREKELARRHEALLKEWQDFSLRAVKLRKQPAQSLGHITSAHTPQAALYNGYGAFHSLEERLARIEETHCRVMGLVNSESRLKKPPRAGRASKTSMDKLLSLMQTLSTSIKELKREIQEARRGIPRHPSDSVLRIHEESQDLPENGTQKAASALPTSDSHSANPEYQMLTGLAGTISPTVHPAPLEHQGIKYRWEPAGEGFQVLVLLPTVEQYADLKDESRPGRPALLSCADALGGKEHGVCKIVVPDQFRVALEPPPPAFRRKQKCSRYRLQTLGDGYWRTDPYNSTARLDRSSNKRIEDLRPLLSSGRALPDVFYQTDLPASTEQERKAAGLPCQSPIETLRGNQLHRTRHAILGIHTITKYEGSAGAPFAWHIDDCHTDAINYLYHGTKEWSVIPPADSGAAEKEFRKLVLSAKASDAGCHQFMRHDAVFGIGRMMESAPVRSFPQNAGELVFIYRDAYHSGYSKTYTVAEARNYAGDEWSIEGYRFCTPKCCESPITYEHMRFAEHEDGGSYNGDYGDSAEEEDVDAEEEEDVDAEDVGYEDVGSEGDMDLDAEDADAKGHGAMDAEAEDEDEDEEEEDTDAEGDEDVGSEGDMDMDAEHTDAEGDGDVNSEGDMDLDAEDADAKGHEAMDANAEGDENLDAEDADAEGDEDMGSEGDMDMDVEDVATSAEKQRIEPDPTTLANAVCGKRAFNHLCSLIRAWRARQQPFFSLTGSERAEVQLVRVIEGLSCTGSLLEFLSRLAKSELAKMMDGRKHPDYIYARSADVDAILKELGWENTEPKKRKLRHFICEGRRWNAVCQDFPVCLIPPNRGDRSDLRSPRGAQYQDTGLNIALFSESLPMDEFNLSIRRMGNIFQCAILEQRDVPEFLWENESTQAIERLSLTQLIPLMEEFRVITATTCEFDKWDRAPDNWPWAWPQHPNNAGPGDTRCDLCAEDTCDCISNIWPPNLPRTEVEEPEGRVLRAVAVEGVLAYQKGQLLGELTGEFIPLGSYYDRWSIDFPRPDLDRTVAQLYTKRMGNWVRLVSNSSEPNAELRVMKITGRWRIVLVAVQDIYHNGMITANLWGWSSLRGAGATR